MKECTIYETKIKDIQTQNYILQSAKDKLRDILKEINYVPFTNNSNKGKYLKVENTICILVFFYTNSDFVYYQCNIDAK